MSQQPHNDVHLITGGAGFIGANLAAALLARGSRVIIFDNFSRGSRDNLRALAEYNTMAVEQVDCADLDAISAGLRRVSGFGAITEVWHLAANSDIPAGVADPGIDLRCTFLTTFAVLQLCATMASSA